MWLQIAPIAFASIGWRFYMVFICCALAAAVTIFFTFPDTANKPLEEIAALFGDDDLVAIYQRDVHGVGEAKIAGMTKEAVELEDY